MDEHRLNELPRGKTTGHYKLNTNRSEFIDGAIHMMIVTDGGVIFAQL